MNYILALTCLPTGSWKWKSQVISGHEAISWIEMYSRNYNWKNAENGASKKQNPPI